MRPLPFVVLGLAATYLVIAPVVVLEELVPSMQTGPGSTQMQSLGLVGRLIYGCVIGPAFETAVFQWAPIALLRHQLKLPWSIVLGVSAVAFGLSHNYSPIYVVVAFLVGLVLACAYAVRAFAGGHPFTLTFFIHSLRNLVTTAFA